MCSGRQREGEIGGKEEERKGSGKGGKWQPSSVMTSRYSVLFPSLLLPLRLEPRGKGIIITRELEAWSWGGGCGDGDGGGGCLGVCSSCCGDGVGCMM